MKRFMIAQAILNHIPTIPTIRPPLSQAKLLNSWPDIALDGYLMVSLARYGSREGGGSPLERFLTH